MSDASQFLTGLAQALSAMSLYPDGHPSREGIVGTAYGHLQTLQKADRRVLFSFLGDDVVFGDRPIRSLRGWEWNSRLAGAGQGGRVACPSWPPGRGSVTFLASRLSRCKRDYVLTPTRGLSYGSLGLGPRARRKLRLIGQE